MRPHPRVIAIAAATALFGLGSTMAHADVTPATVDRSLAPGESVTLTKTVSTPEIPPRPDIVLMVDRTGSMGGAIGDVKANMAGIISTVEAAQPDAQWAVASYCDFGEPDPFLLHSNLSDSTDATVAAVNGISLCDGGDGPEAQLNALWETGSGGKKVSFRPDSSRVVVWFGDQPGHDPSGGHTEADATSSLTGADARVIAISVGSNQLDSTGQATRITAATGGKLLSGVSSEAVSEAILDGLSSLSYEVAATPTCDPGLSVALSPSTRTVPSGSKATFEETIQVASDATPGATLKCQIGFSLNGTVGEGFTQQVTVKVPGTSNPAEATCKLAREQGPGAVIDGRKVVVGTAGSGHQIVLGKDGGNITLSGGSGNDLLCAWGGKNVLDGGSGDDTLVVMDGANNRLIGGSGDDTMIGFAADTFDGGTGKNTIIKK